MVYLPTVGLIAIALFATGLNAVQSSQIISRIKRKPAPLWSDVSGACIKGGNERGGIAVSSLADCKRRCETETSFKCRSIGFWKPWWMTTKRLCNLSKENRQSAGTNYKQNCHIPNYHYSEITQEDMSINDVKNGNGANQSECQGRKGGICQPIKDYWVTWWGHKNKYFQPIVECCKGLRCKANGFWHICD